MACCAIAAFVLCNIVFLLRRAVARLSGSAGPPAARNAAVGWSLGSSPVAGDAGPGRRGRAVRRWIGGMLLLGVAGTAAAAFLTERHTGTGEVLPLQQGIAASYSSFCGSPARLSGAREPARRVIGEE
ncbi:MAG: hypothetical protein U1F14_12375 [Steroidobacteraceae bacterium]